MTTKRYSVMVTQVGSDLEVELCQVERNPMELCDALRSKKIPGPKNLPMYVTIRIVDHERAEAQ